MSTEGSAYSLGLSDMLTGSAQQTLDTLKQILSDLEFVAGKVIQTSLLSKIKNTMSDRHIVYRKDIQSSVRRVSIENTSRCDRCVG